MILPFSIFMHHFNFKSKLLFIAAGQTIMAGDPMQMPPILFDKNARDRGLEISMMARLLRRYLSFNNDPSTNVYLHENIISLLKKLNYSIESISLFGRDQ